jgi:predicted dehydrogenase
MSAELQVAMVGCGGVVRRYRKAYRHIEGIRVAVTIDVDPSEAEAAAHDTGTAKSSVHFGDALTSGIDAVVISTPNHFHRQHAVAALDAGKHVLLQKPMARGAAECDEILAAQRRSGKTLGVYMNLLDHALFRDIRRMVREDYLGRVALFSARLAHRGGLSWGGADRNWRASKERTGGGSFIQLGVHYQHLMRWLLDQSVTGLQAIRRNFACPHLEGDDLMMVQYALSGGGLGEIQTSWCCQEEHVSLMGTKGSIHYRDNRVVEYVGEGGPFEGEAIKLQGNGANEFSESIPPEWDDAANPYNQHRRFFEALRAGTLPEVTGEDAREDVRLVDDCYDGARNQKGVCRA